jgi:hypothetical protein
MVNAAGDVLWGVYAPGEPITQDVEARLADTLRGWRDAIGTGDGPRILVIGGESAEVRIVQAKTAFRSQFEAAYFGAPEEEA